MIEPPEHVFRVTLLGTGAPPPILERFGPSTLVEAGDQKFIFDAGRGAMQRLHQLDIPFADITGMFLTHHHSDHVVGFPDLWLTGWIGRPWGQRNTPLRVWGPEGTKQMMEHLPKAFHVDIRVRRKNYSPDGVKLDAQEITEGIVFENAGIVVQAFKVDHGGEELPAFGYRIDYHGHSAVLSGDTTFNENLIRHSQGADLLVHEVTAAAGAAAESAQQLKRIAANHTTPEQAGEIFARVKPKLAVYNHLLLFGGATPEDLVPATRRKYHGPLRVGEDLLRIDIGEEVIARPFKTTPES
jgi:ribonuclease Z